MRHALLWMVLAAILTSASDGGSETILHLPVPKTVAAQAALRTAGDRRVPPPILILEGVELGAAEGITIQVLGPPEPGSSGLGPVLAVTSMVGRPQKTPHPPFHKVTLAVPLNDRAAKFLAGRSDVTLTLKVTKSPGRPAVKVARAFFKEPNG